MPGAEEENEENNNPNPGGEGGNGNPNPNPNPGGEGDGKGGKGFKDLAAANAEIEKLRKESAGYRTKSKDLESKLNGQGDDLKLIKEKLGISEKQDAKQMIADLQAENIKLKADAEFSKTARELGIPSEHEELFATLINQKASKLKDGEELPDQEVQAIVQTINQLAQVSKKGTGVNTPKNTTTPSGGDGEITGEKFAKMTMAEKNALYLKNPDSYAAAFKEAKEKKLLR